MEDAFGVEVLQGQSDLVEDSFTALTVSLGGSVMLCRSHPSAHHPRPPPDKIASNA